MSMEEFDALLKRGSLKLSPPDRERLWLLFEKYKERLEKLLTTDLEGEEVAGVSVPQ